MKRTCLIAANLVGATILELSLIGCSSTPVTLAPVGPSPVGMVSGATTGQLEVYSALQECHDGNEYDTNPAWYQHTDYVICDANGKRVKHVFNSVGHYAQRPRRIDLPPGRYVVTAEAEDALAVEVPVVIEPGRLTQVHLDAAWHPSVVRPNAELVSAPSGYSVGWRVGLANEGTPAPPAF